MQQVLRLLAARRPGPHRAVSTITAAARFEVSDSEPEEEEEGPFFDLDFSSVRASSSSSGSDESSDGACSSEAAELDFVISLHRSRSASPCSYESTLLFGGHPPPLQFCASEPSANSSSGKKKKNMRTLSLIGAMKTKKAAFYGGRPSFASSTRSLRLFMETESPTGDDSAPTKPTKPSGDVIRRYLTKISRRIRSVRPRGRASGDAIGTGGGGLCRLRKSRSASAAAVTLATPSRRDDSLVEKQDGIASAIAHCKESFHRASLSECDSSLLRSRSDPGKSEASS